jgi:hypothetical protein
MGSHLSPQQDFKLRVDTVLNKTLNFLLDITLLESQHHIINTRIHYTLLALPEHYTTLLGPTLSMHYMESDKSFSLIRRLETSFRWC